MKLNQTHNATTITFLFLNTG